MDNIINGVGGNPLLPLDKSRALTVPPSSTKSENKPETLPLETVDHRQYPHLLVGLRNTLVPFETLEKYISWQRSKLEKNDVLRFRNVTRIDRSVQGTMEDLIASFSKNKTDLIAVLKKRLILSLDFEEKVILLKAFFSTENEKELYDSFLLPSLEQKQGFVNFDTNHQFSMYFLSSLDDKTLHKILSEIDYGQVTDPEALAKSLLKITHPEHIFDFLIKTNDRLLSENNDSSEHREKITQIQKIFILCLKELEEIPAFLPKEHLKRIYDTATEYDVRNEMADIIAIHSPGEATQIFTNRFRDDGDFSDETRRKRFYAVSHYANAHKEYAVPTLKEMLYKEEDPFVAAIASYQLVNVCNPEGQGALANLIVKQIRECKPSIPLGIVISLMPYNENFERVIKNVLSRYYKPNEGLKQALEQLENIPLSPISRSDKNVILFNPTLEENKRLGMILINEVGLETLVKWATNNKKDISKEELSSKNNALDILDYAWQSHWVEMTEMFLELMPLGEDSELKAASKGLIGISAAKDEMPELKPLH